ncbi:MAG: sulfatase-like hydrolase/transferase, partial [Boseongicola sp. SB0662_bin_57]|nr:sulfatase-like hydrolase/transferase [Boseongicola sp. SB0662_bin_57]
PHWPYLAPAPYNDMYSAADLPPANRSDDERRSDHPLMQAWMDMRVSKNFSRDEVRNLVAPVYMGLIRELDDNLGRLFAYLGERGRLDDTMIVFCSDHGDNMGDHWLGEKDLFYDCSARVPLIVYDPRQEADATRGTTVDQLVEGVDLTPTFVEFFGGQPKRNVIEGLSLQSLLHGQGLPWREFCVSEYDYATRAARRTVGVDQGNARLTMVFDGRWKYVHVEEMRPMLFDLESDPNELVDLGGDPAFAEQVDRLCGLHFEWTRRHHNRITRTAEEVEAMTDAREPPGILIGYRDRAEIESDGLRLPPHARR